MAVGLGLACKGIADMQITGSMINYNIADNYDVDIAWSDLGRFNTPFVLGMVMICMALFYAFVWKYDVMNHGREAQGGFKPFLWPSIYAVMSVGIMGRLSVSLTLLHKLRVVQPMELQLGSTWFFQ